MKSTTARVAAATTAALAALSLAACSGGSAPGTPTTGAAAPSSTSGSPTASAPAPSTTPSSSATAPTSSTPTPATSAAPSSSQTSSPTAGQDIPDSVVNYSGPLKKQPPVPLNVETISTYQDKPNPTMHRSKGGWYKPSMYGALTLKDRWHFISSTVPFLAQTVDENQKPLANYQFDRTRADVKCNAPGAKKPKNGHFVAVSAYVSMRSIPQGAPAVDLTENTFIFLDKDLKQVDVQLVTPEAKACLKLPRGQKAWGAKIEPDKKVYELQLVFDVPSLDGWLVHSWRPEVGGWLFSPKTSNPKYKTYLERTNMTPQELSSISDLSKLAE